MENSKVLLLGASGLIGSYLKESLQQRNAFEILAPTSIDLDLQQPHLVLEYFQTHQPQVVFNAAGISGGVQANIQTPAELTLSNGLIQSSVINAAYRAGVKKLIQLIPSCIYPKEAPLPHQESDLFTGPLEPTSEYFATAKLYGLMLAKAFNKQYGTHYISAIPSNVYGIRNCLSPEKSHVIPALIAKIKAAKKENAPTVEVWGSGDNIREFLHARDLAEALILLATTPHSLEVTNIGSGTHTSIRALAETLKRLLKYDGRLEFTPGPLSGTQGKYLDSRNIQTLGWKPQIALETGLQELIHTS